MMMLSTKIVGSALRMSAQARIYYLEVVGCCHAHLVIFEATLF